MFPILALVFLAACTDAAPPSSPPAPAVAPTPNTPPTPPPPPPASKTTGASPRAIAFEGSMVVCLKDGQPAKGEECVGQWTVLEVTPPTSGPVTLTTVSASGVASGDPPCDWLVNVVRTGAPQKVELERSLTVLPRDNATYQTLISETTGVPNVTLTSLLKVDLEGDGKDEVLFAANSHPDSFPMGETGLSYSYVGLRRVGPDDQAQTVMLYSHNQQMLGESPMEHLPGRLLGLTDLEGDGRLEIVYADGYYEGESWHVVQIDDNGNVKELGGAGCGV